MDVTVIEIDVVCRTDGCQMLRSRLTEVAYRPRLVEAEEPPQLDMVASQGPGISSAIVPAKIGCQTWKSVSSTQLSVLDTSHLSTQQLDQPQPSFIVTRPRYLQPCQTALYIIYDRRRKTLLAFLTCLLLAHRTSTFPAPAKRSSRHGEPTSPYLLPSSRMLDASSAVAVAAFPAESRVIIVVWWVALPSPHIVCPQLRSCIAPSRLSLLSNIVIVIIFSSSPCHFHRRRQKSILHSVVVDC